MKLDIRFSSRPLEDLWSQAVVGLVFKMPDIASGALAGLNKKMIGTLHELFLSGKWTGDRGEKLLIATQNMIRSDKLFLYGLGPIDEFSDSVLEDEIRNVARSLDKICIRDFGIHLPVVKGLEREYPFILEFALIKIAEELLCKHQNDPDYFLKIIVFMEDLYLDMAGGVIERLRKYFSPDLIFSIIIDSRPKEMAA